MDPDIILRDMLRRLSEWLDEPPWTDWDQRAPQGASLWVAAGILLAVHAALAWSLRSPSLTTNNDHSTYVWLSRALRDGQYREIWRLGTPLHTQYPPVFPVFLALLSAAFGEHLDVLHAGTIAWSVLALLLLFDVTRRLWSSGVALLVLALAALNPFLIERSGEIMAEAPFMALMLLSLWALMHRPLTARWIALGGGAVIAGALTRSAGLPVVVAVGLFLLLERRIRAALAYAAVVAVTAGAWVVWTLLAPVKIVGRSYVADAARGGAGGDPSASLPVLLVRRVFHNVPGYLASGIPWRVSVPNFAGTRVDNVFWLVVVTLTLAAGGWCLWRRWRAAAVALLCYAGMLAVWPWLDGRFLEPIVPLLLLVMVLGAAFLGARVSRGAAFAVTLALGLVLGGTAAAHDVTALARMRTCDRANPMESPGCFGEEDLSFFAATKIVLRESPDTARVLVAKDAPFAMMSRRTVLALPEALVKDSTQFFSFLAAQKVGYIVLTHVSFSDKPLADRLLRVCRRLVLLHTIPPFSSIYTYLPEDQPSRDESNPACIELRRYHDSAGPVV
jgi:hypothetical protein